MKSVFKLLLFQPHHILNPFFCYWSDRSAIVLPSSTLSWGSLKWFCPLNSFWMPFLLENMMSQNVYTSSFHFHCITPQEGTKIVKGHHLCGTSLVSEGHLDMFSFPFCFHLWNLWSPLCCGCSNAWIPRPQIRKNHFIYHICSLPSPIICGVCVSSTNYPCL